LLTLDEVVTGYGSAPVLHGVSVEVAEGEAAVILGPNGAGKTTALRAVSGLIRVWKGQIKFDGRPLSTLPAHAIARLGVGIVPAAPGVFRELSVLDNLRVGAFALGDRRRAEDRLAWMLSEFSHLAERKEQQAGSLSGGEQRMLAIARALMAEPRLLLVDEASMGLSPAMVSTIFRLLDNIRRQGLTLCLVEQSRAALDIAGAAYLLAKGVIVDRASGSDVGPLGDRAAAAYLGRSKASRP
jgi:branched-chain amino acid transport system ATP-binding protein